MTTASLVVNAADIGLDAIGGSVELYLSDYKMRRIALTAHNSVVVLAKWSTLTNGTHTFEVEPNDHYDHPHSYYTLKVTPKKRKNKPWYFLLLKDDTTQTVPQAYQAGGVPLPPNYVSIPGPQGPAGTVAVDSTVTGAPGSPASVVNIGTPEAAELVFTVPEGVQGDTGLAATIAVGDVDTVPPTDPATVVNAGTPQAAVLDFEIPQGVQGIQGIQGIPGYEGQPTKVVATDTYTMLPEDLGYLIYYTSNNPVLITLPAGFDPERRGDHVQWGAGALTFVGDGTSVVRAPGGMVTTTAQYVVISTNTAPATEPDEWLLVGALA